MNAARKYSIAWKGLSEGEHTFDFEAGDDLFRLFENTEIKGGHCDVKVNLLRAARQLRLEISIRGNVFCFNPSMLLIDTTAVSVVQIFITSLIGVFGLSASLEGFLFVKMPAIVRVMLAVGGLMLINPTLMTDILGLLLIVAGCAWQKMQQNKTKVVV